LVVTCAREGVPRARSSIIESSDEAPMSSTRTSKSGRRGQPSGLTSGGKKAGGKKGRRPGAPIKVGNDRNWGPIVLFVAVGVIAAGIIAYAFVVQRSTGSEPWQDRAAAIEGIVNYNETNPDMLGQEHTDPGPVTVSYEVLPPVGGEHNPLWQNCSGMVYDAQIPNEHAVHALEHGAVWITYDPALPADQVETLAGFVENADYTFMSPFPELDAPISMQAWGYQLKLDDANDERLREFILTLRNNAGPEQQATCGGPQSVTATGTTPVGGAGVEQP
jgi:hypothetical protein